MNYYETQLNKLGTNFKYPVSVKLWSEHGETKSINLNEESTKALIDLFKRLGYINEGKGGPDA